MGVSEWIKPDGITAILTGGTLLAAVLSLVWQRYLQAESLKHSLYEHRVRAYLALNRFCESPWLFPDRDSGDTRRVRLTRNEVYKLFEDCEQAVAESRFLFDEKVAEEVALIEVSLYLARGYVLQGVLSNNPDAFLSAPQDPDGMCKLAADDIREKILYRVDDHLTLYQVPISKRIHDYFDSWEKKANARFSN